MLRYDAAKSLNGDVTAALQSEGIPPSQPCMNISDPNC